MGLDGGSDLGLILGGNREQTDLEKAWLVIGAIRYIGSITSRNWGCFGMQVVTRGNGKVGW